MFSAVQSGENPRETAKRLRGRFVVSKSRAERIARTEITGALRRGRWDEARDAQDKFGIETRLIHYSALIPGRTRDSHAERHGRIVTIEEQAEWYEQDGNGINCFMPGTRVAGQFVAGSKARYEGPAVRIVTASGNDLSVTPNHPVMTERGLVPAAEIQEGDNLIAYQPDVKDIAGVSSLNGELVNAAIENVYCSLVDLGHTRATGVSAVDFHGDGRFVNENIQVVNIEGVLPVASNPALAQLLQDFSFVKTDAMTKRERALAFYFQAIDSPAPSFMSSGSASLSLSGSEPSAFDALRVTRSSDGQAALCEPSLNSGPADPVFFADCQDRKPRDVVGVHGGNVMPSLKGGALACMEAFCHEPNVNGSVRHSDAIRNLLKSFAGLAALDKVVNIDRFTFAGHVYDLQEVSGLMVADGIITSNCLCSATEVIVDSDGNLITGEKLRERMGQAKAKFERESKVDE